MKDYHKPGIFTLTDNKTERFNIRLCIEIFLFLRKTNQNQGYEN